MPLQGSPTFLLLWQAFMPMLALAAVEANRASVAGICRWCCVLASASLLGQAHEHPSAHNCARHLALVRIRARSSRKQSLDTTSHCLLPCRARHVHACSPIGVWKSGLIK